MKEQIFGSKVVDGAGWGYRSIKVIAKGGLHMIRGNGKPYFSLTCDIYSGLKYIGGGASHDLILKHFPELAPLAKLHLSDIDGVPMHAAANGLYYIRHLIPGASGHGPFASSFADPGYSGGKKRSDAECIQIMADHFRLGLNEARGLHVALIDVANGISQYERVWGDGSKKAVRAAMDAWVEAQKPRWKAEADRCIKDLGLVVFGDPYIVEVAA